MEKRKLGLTPEEIKMIEFALEWVYGSYIEIVKENRGLLNDKITKPIFEKANKFDDLRYEISKGKKDIN